MSRLPSLDKNPTRIKQRPGSLPPRKEREGNGVTSLRRLVLSTAEPGNTAAPSSETQAFAWELVTQAPSDLETTGMPAGRRRKGGAVCPPRCQAPILQVGLINSRES